MTLNDFEHIQGHKTLRELS